MLNINRYYFYPKNIKFLFLSYLVLLFSLSLFSGTALAKDLVLPDGISYPEGIAIADDGTIYMGSLKTGTIVRLQPGATAMEVFAIGQLTHGAMGMVVDKARGILWVCDSAPSFSTPGITSALVGLSLLDGTKLFTHPINPIPANTPVLCNDVIIHNGALLMTESIGGRVLRVPREKVGDGSIAEEWIIDSTLRGSTDVPFGANGLEILADYLYVANSGQRSIVQFPLNVQNCLQGGCGKKVTLLDLQGNPTTFVGFGDGLAAVGNNGLLVVDNAILLPPPFIGGNSLNAIYLDHATATGYMRAMHSYDFPTTVAIDHQHVVWVVEGQLNSFFNFDSSQLNTPFKAVGIPLYELLTKRY